MYQQRRAAHPLLLSALLLATLLLAACAAGRSPSSTETPPGTQIPGVLLLDESTARWSTDSVQEVLEDPSGSLTLADVTSSGWSSQFRPWSERDARYRISSAALWVRLRIRHQADPEDAFLLQYPHPDTDSLQFYRIVAGDPVESVITGSRLPFSTREIPHTDYLFRLHLERDQETEIHVRVQSQFLRAASFNVWTQDAFLAYDGLRQLIWGIYFGILVALQLFYIYLALSLRQWTILVFAVWNIGIALFLATLSGLGHMYLWSQRGSQTSQLLVLLAGWILGGLIFISRSSLETSARAPQTDKVLLVLAALLGLTLLASAFVHIYVAGVLLVLLMVAISITIRAAAFTALKGGYRPARVFLLLMLLPLGLILTTFLPPWLGGASYPYILEIQVLPMVTFVAFLPLVLDRRLSLLRRENEANMRKLHANERRLRQYLDAMPLAIDVRTPDGALVFHNKLAATGQENLDNPAIDSVKAFTALHVVQTGTDTPYPWEKTAFNQALQGAVGYADDMDMVVGNLRSPTEAWSSPILNEEGKVELILTALNDISARRKAQTELGDLRHLYERIVQDQSVMICRYLPDGTLLFANNAFRNLFGNLQKLPMGLGSVEVLENMEQRITVGDVLTQLTPHNPTVTHSTRFTTDNGEYRWLQWTVRGIFDGPGILFQCQSTIEDITEVRDAEERMRRYQDDLAAEVAMRTEELATANQALARRAGEIAVISLVTQTIATEPDPIPALQQIAEMLCRLLDARAVGVNIYDIPAQTRMLIAWHPPSDWESDVLLGKSTPLQEYLFRERIANEMRTVIVRRGEETRESAQITPRMTAFGIWAVVAVPLLSRSTVVGDITLNVDSPDWTPPETDLRMLETIAGQLAASLELGKTLRSEQLERRRAEGLQEMARIINASLDLPIVLSAVLTQLAKVTEFDGASIWLREGNELVLSQAAGVTTRYRGFRVPLDAGSPVGQVYASRTLVAIPDATGPQWSNDPDELPYRSWIGAPMMAEDEVIGVLCIERQHPGFPASDATTLPALADTAAIAVLNAHLFEQAHAAAAMGERERLARDLHDAVTQTIFSASILAEVLPMQLERQPEMAKETAEKLHMLTRSALAELRSMLMELRPSSLTSTPLEVLMRDLVDALTSRAAVQTQLVLPGTGLHLPEAVQLAFYRVAQEAFNNIAKHAGATEVRIDLHNKEECVILTIEDDGRGFDHLTIQPKHFGLQIMQERADAIGAQLCISSIPGTGTSVTLEWRPTNGVSHE